jgi:deazaflavin-dependent oxidoreductase (nitroreductase family)
MMTRPRPVLDVRVARALERGQLIDITTHGRETGQPRRIELAFHNFEDRIYITGRPGKRAWYANLLADPHFVFHLKRSPVADLPATARPITDVEERRRVLAAVAANWGYDLGLMVASAPLVEVTFEPGVR